MDEMGHTDPGLALRIYRQAMRRGDEERARLRELLEGPSRNAAHGSAEFTPPDTASQVSAEA
jgi:hypothetical protein